MHLECSRSAVPTPDPKTSFEVLRRLTAQLTEDRPLEDFLRAVTDASLGLLGADHASIRLLDTTRASLLSNTHSGSGEDDRPMSFRRGEGILGWVVEHGEPARIDDVEHDSRWLRPTGAQGFRIGSIVAEPLWSSGEVIGVPDTPGFRFRLSRLLRRARSSGRVFRSSGRRSSARRRHTCTVHA
jgi:hypothetical protein